VLKGIEFGGILDDAIKSEDATPLADADHQREVEIARQAGDDARPLEFVDLASGRRYRRAKGNRNQ
jgi:hypothetical protein